MSYRYVHNTLIINKRCHPTVRNHFAIASESTDAASDKTPQYFERDKPHDMGASPSAINMTKSDLVAKIKARLESVDPKQAKELGGVFLFNVIKGTSVYSWTLDLNNVTVYEGEPEDDPDTTFTLNEHYFKQLVSGREDPRVIMQAGRCSVTGDVMRAMKLEPYIKLE